jgi:hypothetical protein
MGLHIGKGNRGYAPFINSSFETPGHTGDVILQSCMSCKQVVSLSGFYCIRRSETALPVPEAHIPCGISSQGSTYLEHSRAPYHHGRGQDRGYP